MSLFKADRRLVPLFSVDTGLTCESSVIQIIDDWECCMLYWTVCRRRWHCAGSKNTPAPKMGVEVVGTTGRLIMDDVGDGKNPAGEWTGTYKNTGVIWRGDKQVSADVHDCPTRLVTRWPPRFRFAAPFELAFSHLPPASWAAQEEFHATQEYVDIVKPNVGADDQVTALPGA